ncbi:MAG: hypothetical protein M1832_004816 [Thelocarpon impressellum]|nr:MAG: hypothetical protein M1832_004816 [Thelocarpon impressellum]
MQATPDHGRPPQQRGRPWAQGRGQERRPVPNGRGQGGVEAAAEDEGEDDEDQCARRRWRDRHVPVHDRHSTSPSPSPSPPSPPRALYQHRTTTATTACAHPPPLPHALAALMASSELDQRFLGQLAKNVATDNSFLSAMLFKVFGLSIVLSKKLVRARKLRRLDTTRDTKSLQLYHHIIWLSREGLVIVEQYCIPMVANYTELKVLSHKLRASFYHIFVLFHNHPPSTQASIPARPLGRSPAGVPLLGSTGASSAGPTSKRGGAVPSGAAIAQLPPGLAPVAVPKPSSSFLLPAMDYIPRAYECFEEASKLARQLLSGSHPLRLSVQLEYAAFVYDCLRDGEASRRLAKQTIADVYNAQEGMDDQMFQDAAELVGVLGKMAKRGLSGSSGSRRGGGTASTSTSASRTRTSADLGAAPSEGPPPAVPSPGMANPI